MLNNEPDELRLLAACKIFRLDPGKAFEEMKSLAELGSTTAAINIGWAYRHGKGVQQDISLAIFWLRKAFDMGDPAASYYLGNLYSSLGEKDKANFIYKSGVERGYFPSAYCLAMNILEKGDDEKARAYGVELLKWAAGFGHAYSIRKLADLYMHGEFGLLKIPYGVYLMFKSAWTGFVVSLEHREDDRLHS
jgi:hypothetical protein